MKVGFSYDKFTLFVDMNDYMNGFTDYFFVTVQEVH